MSEDIREEAAGEAPADATPAAPDAPVKSLAETGVATPPAADPTPAPADATPASKTDKFIWPEDWRDRLAGGDEKLKSMLSRYSSIDNVAKAFKEQRDALAKKGTDPVPELPENATKEQIDAYRKAKGVPDKPEDYEFEVPEGKNLSDSEYDILMDFAKEMHGKNMPKGVVKDISSWFLNYEDVVNQKLADNAFKNRTETEEKLRAEWGGDFKANINLMSNVLQEHLGTKTGDFLGMRMMDGTKLGDNETFIRLLTDLSRKVGGSTAELYSSDVATSTQSLEARKSELMKMMTSADPVERKKYWSDSVQDEMKRIVTAQTRRAS